MRDEAEEVMDRVGHARELLVHVVQQDLSLS